MHGGGAIWAAAYNGDGLRTTMQDTANGSFPTQHNYTLGLGGVLYDALNSTTYTPGVSQRVNGADTFFHTDWLGSTRYLTDSTGNNFPSALRYGICIFPVLWFARIFDAVGQFLGLRIRSPRACRSADRVRMPFAMRTRSAPPQSFEHGV